jgi:hypothetical protein
VKGSFLILALYVDDGLVVSEDMSPIDWVLDKLAGEFEVQVKEVDVFVGIEIIQNEEGMNLTQILYIQDMLHKFNMSECRSASVPMQPNLELLKAEQCDESLPYRELIGSLLFLARVTRPDIMFAVGKLSQFTHCYSTEHWKAAKDILRYLHETPTLGLHYEANENFDILAYTDSDYAGDKLDRKSTSGCVTFANDSLISWTSQKQDIVSLSSTEAEYIALASGAREVMWLRNFAEELGEKQSNPTPILCDNTSSIRLVENPEFHKRTKHIDVRYHYIRELAENGEVIVKYVSTQEQKADILTKPLAKTKHKEMRDKLNLSSNEIIQRSGGGTKPGVFWTLVTLLGMMTMAQSTTIQNSQPVLWRGSKTPIISGYEKVNLRIHLISPCSLITDEVVHTDVLDTTIDMCNQMYTNYFTSEMQKMCPTFENNHLPGRRQKRFVVTGTIAIVSLVVVGLGIGGAAIVGATMSRLSSLEEFVDLNQQRLDYLEKEMNFTEAAHKKLRRDVNRLILETEVHEGDFDELKTKSPNSHFTLSYITTHLMIGKGIIRDSIRAWENHKILPSLMDYFNISLPCGDTECNLPLATANKCYFGPNMDDLYFELDIPKVNKEMQLVEADPFDLFLQTWNQTCKVVYTGPKNAILSKADGCPIALNVRVTHMYDLVLAPTAECMKEVKNPSNSFFTIDHCYEKGDADPVHYIQVKPHHGLLHIYCYGNNITTDQYTQACPKEVFLLPIGARFKINNQEFLGSIVDIEHSERPDPLFTMRMSRFLKPRVDFKALLEDPMLNHQFVFSKGEHRPHYWGMDSMFLVMIGIISVLCLILGFCIVKCYLDNRKIRFNVYAKPRGMEREVEVAEPVGQD